MSTNNMSIVVLAVVVAGCSAVGQLTVKDYKAKSGERVMAGQAEPKAGGLNVNAFKDAQVVYYKCASLPASN